MVRDCTIAERIAGIEKIDCPFLHIGDIAVDLACTVHVVCLSAVNLSNRVGVVRQFDIHRILRDIARRTLVLAAKDMARVARTAQSLDRQLVARRRVSVMRKTAINLVPPCLGVGFSRTIIGYTSILETIDFHKNRGRCTAVRIGLHGALMRIRRSVNGRVIIREIQRIRCRTL